jgi:diguanylate cyclase (GGDEF)-like protein
MATFHDLLQTRSLRFWIGAGMLVALVPVVTAAVGGFIVLHNGAVGAFQDVAHRQSSEILPAQRIGLQLWDVAISVDEFVEEGNPTHKAAYRAGRTGLETDFASLLASLNEDEPVAHALVKNAEADWTAAEAFGEELVSVLRPAGDPQTVETTERFHGAVRAVSDSLAAAIEHLEGDIAADQVEANLAYERSLWLAAIGAGVCLITIVAGILLIGRVMVASVDRLVDGATLFAEGDRSHRIDIRVPPELRRVANEFNRMIGKIDAYEDLLSQKALSDVLTGLPNRRAFEEAFTRQWDSSRLSGDAFALLQIDVDHFKAINDTYGHAGGDEVLKEIAVRFTQHLRAMHPVFRTGGEEFVVLVPHAGVSDASEVGEVLRDATASNGFEVAGRPVAVTISIGVADSSRFASRDKMIDAADRALYSAKVNGRNQVVAAAA